MRRGLPRKGDVLITTEAPLGEVAILKTDERVALAQRVILLRAKAECVDPDYLFFALQSEFAQGELRARGSGTTVLGIKQSELLRARIPHFPIDRQRRIASILSAYNDLIENCQRRIRILEEIARGLYREWFVHFRFPGADSLPRIDSPLGPIPQGWRVGRLDDLLVLQRGFDLPKGERREGDVPVIAATGVTGFHSETKVRGPGVVTGRSGSIGDVLYVHQDFWPLNTTLWVKEFARSRPLVAYYALSAIDLAQLNSGAAVPTLNRNDVHGLPVVIPPMQIQDAFEQHAGVMHRQVLTLQTKVANLRRTRDVLLPHLMSGQIDPRSAELNNSAS
ncbi:MAG: restriction endonuclease subunit S [Nitrospiraceae bacterium]|nr:restriction endonuclease subunit S [Nitrospiraceae bacterium]